MSGKGKNAIDMTGGSLWKNILVFSLPLMMTQMLEVLFNLSDVAIAGKYADCSRKLCPEEAAGGRNRPVDRTGTH